MSDSENYFSDSDKSIQNDKMDDPMYDPDNDNIDGEDDYEMDEETRLRIYYACLNSRNTETNYEAVKTTPKKKREKNKPPKESSKINLKEFFEKKEEPVVKKWSSSRFKNKKSELGITNDTITKRCFNPRLPIPNQHTFKKSIPNNLKDEPFVDVFPTLGTIACKASLIV